MADVFDRLKAALSDRYAIERELGAGGMATVYLAQDLKHHRKVAVKVMRPELSAILGDERFLREIRIAAKLNHPHILALYDSGEADGFLYYVMPHVEGESLRSKIDQEKQLSIDDALGLTRQVASALDYAHGQGVIHRDIKPENILLHRGEAVVADFGIALAVTAAGGERLTETGLSLGTPEYMSPEQATGERDLDARSDIYSLGAVLYEMVTGEPPQTGATVQAVIAKLLSQPPVQPRMVRDSVPEVMDRAIMKALAKVPADRVGSAAEFAEALTAEVVKPEDAVKSIVVLPFENLSPDPDNEYFADGLTEELIAELSGIGALRVISRTTAMQLKGSNKDVATISRELNVQYVLEGSVRKVGNALRITAQLINATEDAHLWADRYTGTMDDVFEVQERLARKIVEQLKVSLTPEEDDRLTRPRITDPLAYECYLRAKQHLTEFTPDGTNRAISLLKKGLEIEGPNELLYTTMGNACSARCIWGSGSGEALEEAEQWAAKAFELNADSPGGHVVRGSVLFYRESIQEAVAQFKQALRSDPDNSDALFHLVFVAGCSGHLDAARSYYERLAAVDPMARGVNTRWCDYYSGKFDAATDGYRVEWEMDPGSPYTRWAYGMCLAWAGRIEEGCEILGRIVEDSPATSQAQFAQFLVPALQKDQNRALAAMTPELEALAERDIQYSWMIGAGYAMLGMVEEALTWLKQAMSRGFINYPFLAEHEPFLAGIRSEPAFQELMQEVKRRWEAFEP